MAFLENLRQVLGQEIIARLEAGYTLYYRHFGATPELHHFDLLNYICLQI